MKAGKFLVQVVIENKPYINDPEGETIHRDLVVKGGYAQVKSVRAAKMLNWPWKPRMFHGSINAPHSTARNSRWSSFIATVSAAASSALSSREFAARMLPVSSVAILAAAVGIARVCMLAASG